MVDFMNWRSIDPTLALWELNELKRHDPGSLLSYQRWRAVLRVLIKHALIQTDSEALATRAFVRLNVISLSVSVIVQAFRGPANIRASLWSIIVTCHQYNGSFLLSTGLGFSTSGYSVKNESWAAFLAADVTVTAEAWCEKKRCQKWTLFYQDLLHANTINHQLFSLMDSLSICLVNVFNRFMWKSLTISLMFTYKEIVI